MNIKMEIGYVKAFGYKKTYTTRQSIFFTLYPTHETLFMPTALDLVAEINGSSFEIKFTGKTGSQSNKCICRGSLIVGNNKLQHNELV